MRKKEGQELLFVRRKAAPRSASSLRAFLVMRKLFLGCDAAWGNNQYIARNLILLVAILMARMLAASRGKRDWAGLWRKASKCTDLTKQLCRTFPVIYREKCTDFRTQKRRLGPPKTRLYLESYLDGKVGVISYVNSDHTPVSKKSIEIAVFLNAPEAEWSQREKYYVGKVSGEIKYMVNYMMTQPC
jgi:hypothetical protein